MWKAIHITINATSLAFIKNLFHCLNKKSIFLFHLSLWILRALFFPHPWERSTAFGTSLWDQEKHILRCVRDLHHDQQTSFFPPLDCDTQARDPAAWRGILQRGNPQPHSRLVEVEDNAWHLKFDWFREKQEKPSVCWVVLSSESRRPQWGVLLLY